MTTAVEGLRVLEVSVGMALAEKGAEVIKVKPPTGDALRGNPGFLVWRLGKKSVTLDLKIPVGVANFKGLVPTVDAVIEDMAPGDAERLGIGYQRLRDVNSRLVYAATPCETSSIPVCGVRDRSVSNARGQMTSSTT
ncbi:MAG: CoA transferase [Chloroflexi bacterium]|nr:CoA transferase [Chloroflexota bacterium]